MYRKAILFSWAFMLLRTGIAAGYHLHLVMPGAGDSLVYLAHYYGKNRPTLYISGQSGTR